VANNFHDAVRLWSTIKHTVLRNYLQLYLYKLNARQPPEGKERRIYYVDGFAGQGQYGDGAEGSALIAAKRAAEEAGKAKNVLRCINVEENPETFQKLTDCTPGLIKQERRHPPVFPTRHNSWIE
jgi:three-Cys-motif partner protein